MAVSNNTCYEVVNIDWLKSLVGSAVQDADGNTVSVDEKSGTTYCPTYKELTDGTFIPYRSVSSSGPASDTDGITVNSTCLATGEAYTDNQLVNKHDVAVCNTRLKSFTVSIASSTTNISGCDGDTRNLSYTRTFTRNTWDMSKCETQTGSNHSSTDVNDTRNNLVSWTTNIGSITASTSAGSGNAVTVGKNTPSSTGGSASRTITVTGSSTFRGSTSGATASVIQGGVSGSMQNWYTGATSLSNYRIECTGSTFGCAGGSYSAAAVHSYKITQYTHWVDECGVAYDSWTGSSEGSTVYTATDYTHSGSFSDITSTGGDNSASWSKEGYEGSCSWSQSCSAPSTTYVYGTGSTSSTASCDGGSVTVSADNIPYTATTTYGDGSTASTTGTTSGTATISVPKCEESTGCSPSDTVSASPNGYITYTITQNNCSTDCPTQSDIINTSTTVANTGGTQVEVMQILKDSTYTAYTITATSTSSSYVSNINQGAHLHDNWYVVLADVTANPNTSDRSLYFDVIAEGPTLGTGCTYNNVAVTQKGGCPTVYYYGSTIPTEGSPMGLPLMYWSPSDDYPLNTFSVSYTGDGITSTEFITSSSLIPGQTVNVLLVKFSANTGTSSRTFNIHLSTSVSSDCTWDNTYTQEGATQTCDCNAITYSGTYEDDPTPVTPDDGKITVKVDLNDGTTSPAIHFVDSSNTQLLGVSKYSTDTTTTGTWQTTGTCSKIKLFEMGGNYTRISITIQNTGQAPVTILSNATLPSTSGSFINLTTSFNVLDYYDSNKSTVTLTFR